MQSDERRNRSLCIRRKGLDRQVIESESFETRSISLCTSINRKKDAVCEAIEPKRRKLKQAC